MRHSLFSVGRTRRGVSPVFIFFLVGVALLAVGAALPGLTVVAFVGLFIVLTYVIVAVVWIAFSMA